MDDLASRLQSILNSPEGQEQLRSIAGMLGMDGGSAPPDPAPKPAQQSAGSAPDLADLFRSLGGGASTPGSAPPSPPAGQPGNGGFDLSSLLSALGGANGGTQPQPSAGGAGMPNIDMNTILALQQIFAGMNREDKNSQLLLALKPHFGERRRSKVDQAIQMMRLFSILPALRESGIFAGL